MSLECCWILSFTVREKKTNSDDCLKEYLVVWKKRDVLSEVPTPSFMEIVLGALEVFCLLVGWQEWLTFFWSW